MNPESLFFVNVVCIVGMLLTCLWLHALTADRINKLEKSRTVQLALLRRCPTRSGPCATIRRWRRWSR